MADTLKLRLAGLDKFIAKTGNVQRTIKLNKAIVAAGAEEVKGKTSRYPPATIANSPGNPSGRWYERGFGPRWAGGSGGKRTSEVLGKRWYTKQRRDEVEIGNTASYARYVHGEKQARFHGARGWKKLRETAEAEVPRIRGKIIRQLRKALQ